MNQLINVDSINQSIICSLFNTITRIVYYWLTIRLLNRFYRFNYLIQTYSNNNNMIVFNQLLMIDDLITDDHDAQSLTMLSDRSVAAGF